MNIIETNFSLLECERIHVEHEVPFLMISEVLVVVVVFVVAVISEMLQERIVSFTDPLKLGSGIGVIWILVWMCAQRNLWHGNIRVSYASLKDQHTCL